MILSAFIWATTAVTVALMLWLAWSTAWGMRHRIAERGWGDWWSAIWLPSGIWVFCAAMFLWAALAQ